MSSIQRVILSLTDKTGLVPFAQGLSALGAELISTGGTAKILRGAGLEVKDVSDVTGFPEMMDGRLKTIHPKIAGGILGMRDKPDHVASMRQHGIPAIDMVVVNLYDFAAVAAKTDAHIEDLIENIDIGGPTMIRAAAKNFAHVAVVVSPADYAAILDELNATGALSLKTRWDLARKALALTARYDSAITARLSSIEVHDGGFAEEPSAVPHHLAISAPLKQSLRYGENPHQRAALYASGDLGIAGAEQLHGKEL